MEVFIKHLYDSPEIKHKRLIFSLMRTLWKTARNLLNGDRKITVATQYDKKRLYDEFVKVYPEFSGRLKQRDFTKWLRSWGDYKKLVTLESHSGDNRYVQFTTESYG